MKLIDVQEAIKLLRGKCVAKYPSTFIVGLFAAADEIEKLPEVEAVPVVHGSWRLIDITGKDSNVPYVKYAHVECSVCRDVESSVLYNRRFCPNCGAHMIMEEQI